MKRFIVDAVLILILVAIGSTLSASMKEPEESMQEKMDNFQKQVESREIVGEKKGHTGLAQINENAAGQLGSKASEMVISFVEATLKVMSAAFDDFAK